MAATENRSLVLSLRGSTAGSGTMSGSHGLQQSGEQSGSSAGSAYKATGSKAFRLKANAGNPHVSASVYASRPIGSESVVFRVPLARTSTIVGRGRTVSDISEGFATGGMSPGPAKEEHGNALTYEDMPDLTVMYDTSPNEHVCPAEEDISEHRAGMRAEAESGDQLGGQRSLHARKSSDFHGGLSPV